MGEHKGKVEGSLFVNHVMKKKEKKEHEPIEYYPLNLCAKFLIKISCGIESYIIRFRMVRIKQTL